MGRRPPRPELGLINVVAPGRKQPDTPVVEQVGAHPPERPENDGHDTAL